jgi:transposase
VRGWMRTQLWKVRGGTTATFVDRVRGHAAAVGEPLPEHIERQLRMLAMVVEEVKAADKQLQTLAGEHAVCRRLMTVPGIGPLTALRFVAAIDDPTRFATAHRVQSYLGLTPGERSSSERERRTGITKAGPMELRRTLIQSAWVAMCLVRTSHPMIDWARRLAERRGRPVAAVALARKLAGILFAMWRDGTSYQSKRSAEAVMHT